MKKGKLILPDGRKFECSFSDQYCDKCAYKDSDARGIPCCYCNYGSGHCDLNFFKPKD